MLDLIVTGYSPERVILFGSQSQGTANRLSDIDLLIIKDDELQQRERNRVVRRLLKDLIIPVDVIVKISKEFEKTKDIVCTIVFAANKYGKLLYHRKNNFIRCVL